MWSLIFMTPQQLNNLAKLLMEWWHMWVIGSHIKPPNIIAKRSSVVKCGFVYSFHFTLRRRAFMMFFCLISSRNFTLNIIHVSTNKYLLVESNNTHVRFFFWDCWSGQRVSGCCLWLYWKCSLNRMNYVTGIRDRLHFIQYESEIVIDNQ